MEYNELTAQLKILLNQKFPRDFDYNEVIAEALQLDRRSVLRKWRGDTRFTATELIMIAKKFSISLDQLYIKKTDKHTFELYHYNSPEVFWEVTNKMMNIYDTVTSSPESHCMVVSNILPVVFWGKSRWLSKLIYMSWEYTKKNGGKNLKKLTEVENHNEFDEILEHNVASFKNMKSSTYILSQRTLQDIADYALYFYNTKYITAEEVTHIRNDIYDTVDYIDELLRKGYFPDTRQSINMYLSSKPIPIDMNILESTHMNVGIVYMMQIHPVVNLIPETYQTLKEWFYSFMPSSIQITMSNEEKREEYLLRQRKLIDSTIGHINQKLL